MTDIGKLVKAQKDFFKTGLTLDLDFREEGLRKLEEAIRQREAEIFSALEADLGKANFEAYETELGLALVELGHIRKKFRSWAKKERVRTPLTNFLSRSYRIPEPYGQVLIISPWNYPFLLAISPLMGALAAGNTAIIKPSEEAPNTSAVLARILGQAFGEEYVALVEGGGEVSQELIASGPDYIFFTGSGGVGRKVLAQAAPGLIPVTLELGGKSPVVVDGTMDLDLAAKRIIWGKLVNAGQTCVAPDYVLVKEEVLDELVGAMVGWIESFYGPDPLDSPDYPRIISDRHFDRILGLMEGGRLAYGGRSRREDLRIEPTLILDVDLDLPLMGEEIFGPILPIIGYRDLDEARGIIQRNPQPLALYVFSEDKGVQEALTRGVSFGGGCINDTLIHLNSVYLPFGGMGPSGMGAYHGKASFETFSHFKSITRKSNLFDLDVRYPPYKGKLGILKKFMK